MPEHLDTLILVVGVKPALGRLTPIFLLNFFLPVVEEVMKLSELICIHEQEF